MRAAIAVSLMLMASSDLQAQAGDPLPAQLSGRYTFVGPGGAIINPFTLVLDGDRKGPSVPGRLTWRGNNCGAQDAPIVANWDGSELRFELQLAPNVNTMRMNGTCVPEPTRFVLKRKPGERGFEGEATLRAVVVTMVAAP